MPDVSDLEKKPNYGTHLQNNLEGTQKRIMPVFKLIFQNYIVKNYIIKRHLKGHNNWA